MKRLFTLFSALALIANAYAISTVTIEDVEIMAGGTGNIELYIDNVKTDYFNSYQIELSLPEGVYTVDSNGDPIIGEGEEVKSPVFTPGNVFTSPFIFTSSDRGLYNNNDQFIGYDGAATGAVVTATSGLLITIPLYVSSDLAAGTVLECAAVNMILAGGVLEEDENLADVSFNVTVSDRQILKETSTELPAAMAGVKVKVERTISAETWSTIVLPFDMSAEQVESAFGAGTKLASYQGYDTQEDDDTGDIIGITINFEAETAITANTPCLIWVPEAITSFNVDDVDIDVDEEPMVNFGTKKKPKAIVGTYVANTEVPEGCLFLSGNNFYYSAGLTMMKGFRAYFDFVDMLTSAEDEIGAKIRINVAGETTSIEGIDSKSTLNGVYNLQGMFIGNEVDMSRQPKGVYIVNGKKVINK